MDERGRHARSLIGIAHASEMLIPLISELRAAWLRRVPPQSGQTVKATARSMKARTWGLQRGLSFDRNDLRTLGISFS